MMASPLAVAVVAVLATLIGIALIVSGVFVYRKAKAFFDLFDSAQHNLANLVNAVRDGALDFRALPKLIEGLTAVTREEVAQLAEIEKVVSTLSGAIFAPNSRDYIEQAEKNTELANRSYEVQQLMRSGIPKSEAEARVDERELWKRMNVTPGMPVMTGEE